MFLERKLITIGVICKPPNQTRFLEFEAQNLKNEHYILGDFNINIVFKRKYILDKPK